MNWGVRITLVFIAFAGLMAYMVVGSFRENIDLVSDTYYADELVYQQRLEQQQNVLTFHKQLTASVAENHFVLRFPVAVRSGQVQLYRPSDAQSDRQVPLTAGAAQVQIDAAGLPSGKYILKADWADTERKYYEELTVFKP